MALFVAGFGLFLFTRRSELVPTIPIMIVVAPIFILRFSRTQPTRKALFYTFVGFVLSMNVALWGLFDTTGPSSMLMLNVARSSLLAALYFLPYAVDRLIYPRFATRNLLSSLIFPMAATAIFFLSSLEGPFDGTTAKTIYGSGPLILQQLTSVVGLWGFIFIYAWLAAIANHAWETGFRSTATRASAAAYAGLILLVVAFGGVRLALPTVPDGDTVKIAAVVLVRENGAAVPMAEIFETKRVSPFEATLSRIEAATRTAALNQARIVTFQEYAMTVRQVGEPALRAAFQRIAKENGIYLSITYAVFPDLGKGENKHLLIDDAGTIRADYAKRYLFGFGDFGETGAFNKGPEIIQVVETPYGRIGLSICRDMNFQSYIRQAGHAAVDIMLGPSYDFPKSTEPSYYHRAIENGFSFVRPTYNGISYAEDFNGRILARMDSDDAEDGIMYADVPTRGVSTIYTGIGDLLGWLCVIGMFGFATVALVNRRRGRFGENLQTP